MNRRTALLLAMLWLPLPAAAENVDLAVVNRIKAEAFQNSQVMDHLFYLTDVYGPRLAGSPGYKAAADWVVRTSKEWGLENVKLEKWGKLGRGWSFSRFSAHIIEPAEAPLIGFPLAWTPGTNGAVSGEAVLAPIRTEADFDKFKGKLRGKFVLTEPAREIQTRTQPDLRRYTEAELLDRAKAPDPAPQFGFPRFGRPGQPSPFRDREEARRFRSKLDSFLKDEGVLAVVNGGSGDNGTVFAASGGSRDLKDPLPPPGFAIAAEHYNRLVRLLEKKMTVKLEADIRARIIDEDQDGYNVIAELPGGKKKDEVVMIGGHLDSWQGGTGATDDAAGCAVMMEVMRILKALGAQGLKLDRTVRMALWDAEELGLIGSREYVKQHFADRENMQVKEEHKKLAGYFNIDNGSGKIRGVYLQGNDMMRPVFQAWFEPFRDLGAGTITIANTSGTDHLSFDAVGLPGFQFIQDPLDYGTRTHHSNMDVYDRVQRGDLMQAVAIVTSFVYNTATRPEMLPRKPLPKPQPSRRGEGGRPTT